jgi:protocatechuate 3,4-dioxygenase alpha subunit
VGAEPTPSQTVGPYFSLGLLDRAANELMPGGLRISGRVFDGAGDPVPDALVEIWQADEEGRYRPDFGWGRSGCDGEGRYAFVTAKPGSVDGQAPHLTMLVFARGLLKPVLTRLYFPDEQAANADDPVLAALEDGSSLVARPTNDGLEFDIRLQGEAETVFFAV